MQIADAFHLITEKNSIAKLRQSRVVWLLLLGSIALVALLLSLYMALRGPDIRILAWFIYFCGALAILYQPRWGVYLILFFALVGDPLLDPAYPFIKNLSSQELIFYIRDSLIFSPMEAYLVLTYMSWLGRGILKKDFKFYKGSMFAPVMIFIGFITLGLAYGLLKGGDLTIALWEVRPMYHMVAIFFLASNLFTRKEHFTHLFLWTSLAIGIESVIGAVYVFTKLGGNLTAAPAITDHPASIQINTIFVLLIAAFLYRTMPIKRLGLIAMLPVVIITYIADQRRAAFVSLAVALILLAILLFIENRKLFLMLLPVALVVGLIYIGVFWNSSGTLAFPIRALKSVLLPASASARDQSSNYYRLLENANASFTVHQRPITGVGFGNQFYVIYNLPDISFFLWWKYLPHNSILYIWVKAGVGAFLALLYFIGSSIVTGTQAIGRTKDREVKAILVTATIYVVMHFLFAYVDLSWGTESMLFIGASIGILNCAEHILDNPIPSRPVRFPWEKQAEPEPLLAPLTAETESKG